MHWGHAVSRDLLTWEHLPIALYPDSNGVMFSGSAVVDWRDTAGFGAEALIAIYTCHQPGFETQNLACSLDQGRVWQKYTGNPVLFPPPNTPDFRDPKVIWYADHWVMCLAAGREIHIYSSPNLKNWTRASVFAPENLPRASVLETPDLFELAVAGSDQKHWVLTLGVSAAAPAGGSGSRYFIGQFDGFTFVPQLSSEIPLWMDEGPDFYAPQTWNDLPEQRRVVIGWMSNWKYARQTPASEWRGMFSIPRALTLVETESGLRLAQMPIAEVNARRSKVFSMQGKMLPPGENLSSGLQSAAWDVEAQIIPEAATRFGFRLLAGAEAETLIVCDAAASTICVDRTHSGQVDFSQDFAAVHTARLPSPEIITLRILFDCASVEVFAQNGLVVLSESIFPPAGSLGLTFFVEGGAAWVKDLNIYRLV